MLESSLVFTNLVGRAFAAGKKDGDSLEHMKKCAVLISAAKACFKVKDWPLLDVHLVPLAEKCIFSIAVFHSLVSPA